MEPPATLIRSTIDPYWTEGIDALERVRWIHDDDAARRTSLA